MGKRFGLFQRKTPLNTLFLKALTQPKACAARGRAYRVEPVF
jgi:hypothetical protein